jgi:hypothetical protein
MSDNEKLYNNMMGYEVSYEDIRAAMKGKPYPMSLTDDAQINAVVLAVNAGIDSHLEACFCPERGDHFERGARKVGNAVLCYTLECVVSVESMPVLLRRLTEGDVSGEEEDGEREDDAGEDLANDILDSLGFDENGDWSEPDND